MNKETTLIYITVGSAEEAKTIGRKLVEERLAASVNIFDNIHSIYWWGGQMQEEPEAVLIAKTKTVLVSELIEKVKAMHSYELPCIVSLPIADGHGPFLDWIREETKRTV
ncbi:MAG TPA: divalent-cation tolerance protein CutA [Deltaproteobacteria bacterium]|nr:divalent-cation tolerance protein CutA [Deltaproteobacteria bacterium]